MYRANTYRNDIQGLRAISAFLIVICHVWMNKISGGVDIFFVISGFFMTQVIMKNTEKSLFESNINFWAKVLRKTFIPVVSVIFLTLFFIFLLNFPSKFLLIKHAEKSAIFIENLYLIKSNLNYLNSDLLNPFQQFWAISIQYQFYILLPILFYVLGYSKRKILIASFIFISFSFVYSLFKTYTDQNYAYFHPLTRFWEFFIGVVAYFFIGYKRKIISLISVFLFLFWLLFALFVPNYFPYPGIASILPVMTAFFFILNLDSNLVSKFLSNNFFVSISKYSFLIYLVHWPVLILYRINYGVDNIDLKGGLLILFLTVIFCVLVKSISEIADLNRIKRVGQVFLVVILLIVVVLGVNSVLRDIERERNDSAYQDWYIKKETSQYSLNDTLKSIEGIGYFKPIQSCNAIDDNGDIKLCLYGNLDSDKIIYLVGSSHITQWVPLFKKFAEENNFKLVQITKGGCLLGDHFVSNVSYECSQWSKNTLDYLINDQYAFKNVVTLSTRTYLPNIKLDIIEDVPKSYIEGWKALKMSNFGSIKIFGIRDNPRFPTSPNLCLIRNVKDPDSCSFNKNHYLATFDPALKYSELVSSLDFNKFYCDKFNCKVYFNNIPIYRDDDHISDLYSFAIYENMKDLLLENFNNLKNK